MYDFDPTFSRPANDVKAVFKCDVKSAIAILGLFNVYLEFFVVELMGMILLAIKEVGFSIICNQTVDIITHWSKTSSGLRSINELSCYYYLCVECVTDATFRCCKIVYQN